MGVAAVAERRGHTAACLHRLEDDGIELGGRHAGHDVRHERVEHLGAEPPGLAHAIEPGGAVQADGARAGERGVGGHIVGHGAPYSGWPRVSLQDRA